MEMTKRFATASRALAKLHEAACKEELSEMERDGFIQRFEFCFEIMWKCGKDYLQDVEGLDVASPKSVIRALREVKLFTDEETAFALQMVNDRNLTAHTYDEELAVSLAERIPAYEEFMQKWFHRMTD
jgi:nucleotidyltransferase substrate binding protein (TIGR01987 family)